MKQEKIGKFILECRLEKGFTQVELAQKLNVTDKAISKWENGRCMPDLESIKSLCEIFDISINELLSGERLTKENYQKKLEENIIEINLTQVKKSMKKKLLNLLKGILSLIILIPLISVFVVIILTIISEYAYTPIYYPYEKVKVTVCEYEEKYIGIYPEHEDGKVIWMKSAIEDKVLNIRAYRQRREVNNPKYLEEYGTGLYAYKKESIDEIRYEDKLLWNKNMELKKCSSEMEKRGVTIYESR